MTGTQGTKVEISAGIVVGSRSDSVRRFLGIPYAAAPFGEHRMRFPQPHPGWTGTRESAEYGPTVPKNPYSPPYSELFVEPDIPGDECLNLNVWTPVDAVDRPVFVWIHGGAFTNGSGALPQYDGTAFARDGVVCITINYRLGADGFLDVGDEATNIGLRDQIAALRWVRENIAAFGGDPSRVTVGGQSAGAMSIGGLLSSPEADGLFAAAILQSGAGHHAVPRAALRPVARELAERLGVAETRVELASVPLDRLLEVQNAVNLEVQTSGDIARWGPVAANMMAFEPGHGDDLLPVLPIEGIRAGASDGLPLLVGSNRHENRLFMVPSGVAGQVTGEFFAGAAAGFGFADPADAADRYLTGADGAAGMAMSDLTTDWMFGIPAIRLAEIPRSAPTFLYRFDWESNLERWDIGASHSLELPFVFDTLDAEGSDLLTGPNAPQSLADDMHAAWVSFITDNEPGWDPYSADERRVRIFDEQPDAVVDPEPDRRRLWDGLR